jgi:hypothetical protein
MLTSAICGQRGKIDRQQVRCHMVGTSDHTVREFVHVSDWSDEETRDPLYADDRMFYKVEKWTRDGMAVDGLLYAGNRRTSSPTPSSIAHASE